MSGTTLALIAIALWVSIGIIVSIVLGRRGHDPFTWWILAVLFGPFAAFLAVWSVREEDLDAQVVASGVLHPAAPSVGDVDVLVGYDGSPAADAAVDQVIELFGARLGRLKIVSVVRFDPADDDVAIAKAALVALANRIAFAAPEIEIAHGRPAAALQQLALEEGFDVLAIGTAGAHHLFGSAADELASHTKVPVLLAGRTHRAA